MDVIVTLLVLGMIAYFSLRSRFKPPKRPGPLNQQGRARAEAMEFRDEADMARDPVCGTYVDVNSGICLRQREKNIYFCSPACRDRFLSSSR